MVIKLSADVPLATAGRILLVAHDLFYRQGIRATGIDQVIAESGVAKRTFYRHYPTKNDLMLPSLEYRHRNFIAWLVEALARHGSNTRAIAPALQAWFNRDGCHGQERKAGAFNQTLGKPRPKGLHPKREQGRKGAIQ